MDYSSEYKFLFSAGCDRDVFAWNPFIPSGIFFYGFIFFNFRIVFRIDHCRDP